MSNFLSDILNRLKYTDTSVLFGKTKYDKHYISITFMWVDMKELL